MLRWFTHEENLSIPIIFKIARLQGTSFFSCLLLFEFPPNEKLFAFTFNSLKNKDLTTTILVEWDSLRVGEERTGSDEEGSIKI